LARGTLGHGARRGPIRLDVDHAPRPGRRVAEGTRRPRTPEHPGPPARWAGVDDDTRPGFPGSGPPRLGVAESGGKTVWVGRGPSTPAGRVVVEIGRDVRLHEGPARLPPVAAAGAPKTYSLQATAGHGLAAAASQAWGDGRPVGRGDFHPERSAQGGSVGSLRQQVQIGIPTGRNRLARRDRGSWDRAPGARGRSASRNTRRPRLVARAPGRDGGRPAGFQGAGWADFALVPTLFSGS